MYVGSPRRRDIVSAILYFIHGTTEDAIVLEPRQQVNGRLPWLPQQKARASAYRGRPARTCL